MRFQLAGFQPCKAEITQVNCTQDAIMLYCQIPKAETHRLVLPISFWNCMMHSFFLLMNYSSPSRAILESAALRWILWKGWVPEVPWQRADWQLKLQQPWIASGGLQNGPKHVLGLHTSSPSFCLQYWMSKKQLPCPQSKCSDVMYTLQLCSMPICSSQLVWASFEYSCLPAVFQHV